MTGKRRSVQMANKVAIVTGASSGIGKEVALAFLREHYAVVLAGRRHELLEQAAADGRRFNSSSLFVQTDVRDPESVRNLFAKTRDTFGRLDVLFNNAGIGAPPVPLEDLAFDRWQ